MKGFTKFNIKFGKISGRPIYLGVDYDLFMLYLHFIHCTETISYELLFNLQLRDIF